MHNLSFRQDGTFTIVQFTDLHWSGTEHDEHTARLMKDIIHNAKPNLVLFTGDVIHYEDCPDPIAAYSDAVAVVLATGSPWAAIFGNHDAGHSLTVKHELLSLQQASPHCLTEAGPVLGNRAGHTVILLNSADGVPSAALYLLDSGSNAAHPPGGFEWITHKQIGWYLDQSAAIAEMNGGQSVPSLAFLHIPLPEYNELWDYHVCYGHNYEGMGCPKVNSGLFAAFVDRGDVKGVFCGHDHVNDFWGELQGIRLHYGRATGYNSYGREGFQRGARVIQLRENGASFDSWLMFEGGEVQLKQPEHGPEKVWKRI
ncbi:metallophosphoesterase family protein [Paenibacillus sp. FSL K6-1096]|uniref:metallophosphoesterase family protein n=1 Tax=Paenibacillus sp. FSL K6-1096 TaxID=2921460 RepID=UPI0030EB1B79